MKLSGLVLMALSPAAMMVGFAPYCASISLSVVASMLLVMNMPGQSEACNRYYTTSADGYTMYRLNRREGITTTVGTWRGKGRRQITTQEWNFPGQVCVLLYDSEV